MRSEGHTQYRVSGKFIEGSAAGMPVAAILPWVEKVVHPGLGMMEKRVQPGKATGSVTAGARVLNLILEPPSGEELG
jgi:hypothetical protein